MHQWIHRVAGLVLAGLPFAAGAQACPQDCGSLMGSVLEVGSGAGVFDATVVVHDLAGLPVAVAPVATDGQYQLFEALPPGEYRAVARAPDYVDVLYEDIVCEPECALADGAALLVTDGGMIVADFELQPSAHISGTVTVPGGNMQGIQVLVESLDGQFTTNTFPDAAGNYSTVGSLPPGAYRVRTLNHAGWVDQAWPDVSCPSGCPLEFGQPVTVALTEQRTGVNFALAAGGRLMGSVVRAVDDTPVAFASLLAVEPAAGLQVLLGTDPDGKFEILTGLPEGDWYLAVHPQDVLLGSVWTGQPLGTPCDSHCIATAGTPIPLTAGSVVGGLDFALQDGARLRGTITAAADGAPAPNATVLVYRQGIDTPVAFGVADAGGEYTTQPFVPGQVRIQAISVDFFTASFGAQCEPHCTLDDAVPLSAGAGLNQPFDFALQRGSRISGSVTGGSGPLAGVTVLVDGPEGFAFALLSDANGEYQTPSSLVPGAYDVRTVNQQGHVDEAWPDFPCLGGTCPINSGQAVMVVAGQDREDVDFQLAPGARLSGTVRRAADQVPVDTPQLWLVDPEGTQWFFFTGQSDGSFDTLTGVPPGTWHLAAFGSDGLLGEVWQEHACAQPCDPRTGTPINVAGADVEALDFTLDAGARLAGRVTDANGTPIVGATVLVFDPQTGNSVSQGTTDVQGDYLTEVFLPGTVQVLAIAGGYLAAAYDNASCAPCHSEHSALLQAQGTVAGIDFALSVGGSISGRIRAPNGVGLGHVVVKAESVQSGYLGAAVTDPDGWYHIAELPPGDYLVIAEPDAPFVRTGWLDTPCGPCGPDQLAEVEVNVSEQVSGIHIQVSLGGRVTGLVRNSEGQPLPNVVVAIEERATSSFARFATTGPDGRFTSNGLPVGEYFVYTSNEDGYLDEAYDDVPCADGGCAADQAAPVRVEAGFDTDLVFELVRGGRIGGRVVDAQTDAPLPLRPTLYVVDADGVVVAVVLADGNGDYLTPALPPGDYYLRSRNRNGFADLLFESEVCFWCAPGGLAPDGTPLAAVALQVQAGVTLSSVDFELAPGAVLEGAAHEAGSARIPTGFVVQVFDAAGRFVTSDAADENGSWRLSNGLPPGNYYLWLRGGENYHDALPGGVPCTGDCDVSDVTLGPPVIVANAGQVVVEDFELVPLPVFQDGFESL